MKDLNNLNKVVDPIHNPELQNKNVFEASTTPPIERLEEMNSASFENFTLEWVYATRKDRFPNGVFKYSGAGDKGRDIVCFIDDPQSENPRWINYQCKYFEGAVEPNKIWEEIAKITYYSFVKDFNPPQKSYFIAKKGMGPTLLDLLSNPQKLKTEFIKAWGNGRKLGKNKNSVLKGDFKDYIDSFDFSIFFHIPPITLIDEHSKTNYHALRFGRGAKVKRPALNHPDEIISAEEEQLEYIQQLLLAYSDYNKYSIINIEVLKKFEKLFKNFKEQRISFYFAEQLKQFGKETYPPNANYNDLMDQVYSGIFETLDMDYTDGHKRLLEVMKQAATLKITDHILKDNIKPRDLKGTCHQLSNEGKIKWIGEDDK